MTTEQSPRGRRRGTRQPLYLWLGLALLGLLIGLVLSLCALLIFAAPRGILGLIAGALTLGILLIAAAQDRPAGASGWTRVAMRVVLAVTTAFGGSVVSALVPGVGVTGVSIAAGLVLTGWIAAWSLRTSPGVRRAASFA